MSQRFRKLQKSFDNYMRFHKKGYKTCDQCGKQFEELGQLNNHKKAKHDQHIYACDKCDLQTLSYSWYCNISSMAMEIKKRDYL